MEYYTGIKNYVQLITAKGVMTCLLEKKQLTKQHIQYAIIAYV